MRKQRPIARAVAVFVAALMTASSPINALAAVVRTPLIIPTGMPFSSAASIAAPALNAVPSPVSLYSVPTSAVPTALPVAAAPASVPAAVPVAVAA
ncbi:MAG: hypothetical protein ACHQ51_16060, partial [Elusimicrobiota bacterium]